LTSFFKSPRIAKFSVIAPRSDGAELATMLGEYRRRPG